MDISRIRGLISANRINLSIAFIASFLLWPNFFELDLYPVAPDPLAIWHSLDQSWLLALNYANIKGLTWGSEFAFTYGPLGFLTTRLGWGMSKYSMLLFDLFVFGNFFLLFFVKISRSRNLFLTLLLLVAVCVVVPKSIGAGYAFVLLIFLAFWIQRSITKPDLLANVLQVLLITLLFYIKFNTGFIALLFFIAGITYRLFYTDENRMSIFLQAISAAVVILIASFILNVDLPQYVATGYNLIVGYNDIMYLDVGMENEKHLAWIILGLCAILFSLRLIFSDEPLTKGLLLFFMFSTLLFVLYKQAFVRADEGHVADFFYYFLLIVFCFSETIGTKATRYTLGPLVALVVIGLYVNVDRNLDTLKIWSKFDKSAYVQEFAEFGPTSGSHLQHSKRKLPERILKKIGASTIDTYPWDISLLLENNLNYHPRPVCQSYTAYTKYLEDLNFNHYNSDNAPQFVLYDYIAIDNRCPLFDETKVNLVLQQKYNVIDSFTLGSRHVLLLERQSDKTVKLQFIREYAVFLNNPLVLEEGIFYEVDIQETLLGKIQSVVKHAPELKIEIRSSGKASTHRTSSKLLSSGVLGAHVLSTADYSEWIDSASLKEHSLNARLYFKPRDPACYGKKVRIKEYKY